MTKVLHIILLVLVSGNLYSTELSEKISKAIEKSDAKELCSYFNSSIELTVIDNEDIYSKSQSEVILTKFFKENIVESFEIVHQGGNVQTSYFIGNLTSSKNKYRVYFLIKENKAEKLIHQLRIDLIKN